jgi:hypothetical protein
MRPLQFLILAMLLLAGCAGKRPPESRLGPQAFPGLPDTLYLAPVSPQASGGVFRMERLPEKSRGTATDYLRVWRSFLRDHLQEAGTRLLTPQSADSSTLAAFACPQSAAAWRSLYGAVPGPGSRILLVEEMDLLALRRPWLMRVAAALTLVDDSRREYAALVLDYRIHDAASGTSGASRRLVSRHPDDPYTTNALDRAGKLMMRAAYDLALDLRR